MPAPQTSASGRQPPLTENSRRRSATLDYHRNTRLRSSVLFNQDSQLPRRGKCIGPLSSGRAKIVLGGDRTKMSGERFPLSTRGTTVLVALALIAWIPQFPVAGQTAHSNAVAIIIGNKEYGNAPYADYAFRDAEAFKRYLISVRQFREQNIVYRHNADYDTLIELFGDPIKAGGLLSKLVNANEPVDEVFVFYSGHAKYDNDNRYLLPTDVTYENYSRVRYPLRRLYAAIERLADTTTIVIFVDTWFSGAMAPAPVPYKRVVQRVSEDRIRVEVSSGASADPKSYHEEFRNHILDGLYGAADDPRNPDNRVDLKEMESYIARLYAETDEVPMAWSNAYLSVPRRDSTILSNAIDGKFPQRELLPFGWSSDHELQRRRFLEEESCPETIRQFLDEHPNWQYADAAKSRADRLEGEYNEAIHAGEKKELRPLLEYYDNAMCAQHRRGARDMLLRYVAHNRALGTRFHDDCEECPELIVVRDKDKQYAIGRYEVTLGEYREYAAAAGVDVVGGCWTYEPVSGVPTWAYRNHASLFRPGFLQDDSHPVVCVNWHDADGYGKWLSRRSGHAYRLPTSNEWLSAARATAEDACRFHFGVADPRDYANYRTGDATLATRPVGERIPNSWGLHDVHGNVWEWVSDCDGERNSGERCSRHVLHGGSWWDTIEESLQVDQSVRNGDEVGRDICADVAGQASSNLEFGVRGRNFDYRISFNGFRIVRDLLPTEELTEDALRKELSVVITRRPQE